MFFKRFESDFHNSRPSKHMEKAIDDHYSVISVMQFSSDAVIGSFICDSLKFDFDLTLHLKHTEADTATTAATLKNQFVATAQSFCLNEFLDLQTQY